MLRSLLPLLHSDGWPDPHINLAVTDFDGISLKASTADPADGVTIGEQKLPPVPWTADRLQRLVVDDVLRQIRSHHAAHGTGTDRTTPVRATVANRKYPFVGPDDPNLATLDLDKLPGVEPKIIERPYPLRLRRRPLRDGH
jgi:hypothetical protein